MKYALLLAKGLMFSKVINVSEILYQDIEGFERALRNRVLSWSLLQVRDFVESQNETIDNEDALAMNWKDIKAGVEDAVRPVVSALPDGVRLDESLQARAILQVLEVAHAGVPELKRSRARKADTLIRERMKQEQPAGPSRLETLRQGDMLEDYEILRELGRGATGVVYLTQHQYLRKRFAVKVLSREMSSRPEFASLFLREAQTLGSLRHKNLVEVYNFGIEDDAQYLVMEYIPGGTLQEHLEHSGGRLPPAETKRILLSVVAGLAHAHSKGIVHRDLKPDNVILDHRQQVKITDFGLARLLDVERYNDPDDPDSHTIHYLAQEQKKRGLFVGGTEGYMAPEVEKGGAGDQRADYYSLGVIAFVMLTGESPHETDKKPSDLVNRLDYKWDKFIAKCLEYKVEERYQDVLELYKDLRRIPEGKRPFSRKPLLLSFLLLAGGVYWLTEQAEPGMIPGYWADFIEQNRIQQQLVDWLRSSNGESSETGK